MPWVEARGRGFGTPVVCKVGGVGKVDRISKTGNSQPGILLIDSYRVTNLRGGQPHCK